MKKLWYDDIRRPPDDTWDWARTNGDAKYLLCNFRYQEMSFDHDMGLHHHDPDEQDADLRIAPDHWQYEDGADLARWMVEQGYIPPVCKRVVPLSRSEKLLNKIVAHTAREQK